MSDCLIKPSRSDRCVIFYRNDAEICGKINESKSSRNQSTKKTLIQKLKVSPFGSFHWWLRPLNQSMTRSISLQLKVLIITTGLSEPPSACIACRGHCTLVWLDWQIWLGGRYGRINSCNWIWLPLSGTEQPQLSGSTEVHTSRWWDYLNSHSGKSTLCRVLTGVIPKVCLLNWGADWHMFDPWVSRAIGPFIMPWMSCTTKINWLGS